jgi:hypothetical protein
VWVSARCVKSMKTACSLSLGCLNVSFTSFKRFSIACRVDLPGLNPNCLSGVMVSVISFGILVSSLKGTLKG